VLAMVISKEQLEELKKFYEDILNNISRLLGKRESIPKTFNEELETTRGILKKILDYCRAQCDVHELAKQVNSQVKELYRLYDRKSMKGKYYTDSIEILEKLEYEIIMEELKTRDHVIHQFNVYLLGLIIGMHLRIFEYPWDYFAWLLASTLHDVGYIYEGTARLLHERLGITYIAKANEIEEALREIVRAYYASHNNRNIDGLYSIMRSILKKIKNSHGIISALVVHKYFIEENPYKDEDPWKNHYYPQIMIACSAIALHSILDVFDSEDEIKEKLERVLDEPISPIPILLVLCDEIQDFGRPGLKKGLVRTCKVYGKDDSVGIVLTFRKLEDAQNFREKLMKKLELIKGRVYRHNEYHYVKVLFEKTRLSIELEQPEESHKEWEMRIRVQKI